MYESVSHDEYDVVFGIDLRRWAESGWGTLASEDHKDKEVIPPIISAMFQGLNAAYEKLSDDSGTFIRHLRE